MTGSHALLREHINLSQTQILLVDGHREGLDVLAEMFCGFGANSLHRHSSAEQAMGLVRDHELNLIVVDDALEDTKGHDFIHKLRRCGVTPNCWAPAILLTGHTKPSEVLQGRDAGATFVIRKPAPPLVMMQRILWVLKDGRRFVDSPTYCGPDRRFRAMGPPAGQKGRRHDDLSVEVGLAKTPNLEQADIDALFQPRAAARQ